MFTNNLENQQKKKQVQSRNNLASQCDENSVTSQNLVYNKETGFTAAVVNPINPKVNPNMIISSIARTTKNNNTSMLAPHVNNYFLRKLISTNSTTTTTGGNIGARKRVALDDVSNINNVPNIVTNTTKIRSDNVILPTKRPIPASTSTVSTTTTNLKKRTAATVAQQQQLKNQQTSNNCVNVSDNVIEKKQKIESRAKKIANRILPTTKTTSTTTNVTKSNVVIDPIFPILSTTIESELYEAELEKAYAKKIKSQEWDDLDLAEMNDPMMVAEYAAEIFDYLKILEKETMPKHNYMESQPELNWKMRTILVDWLVEVHHKFCLLPETLFLTINLVDRFLSDRVTSMVKLQLVGITALFIAAKYEEVISPSIKNYIFMSEDGCTEDEILTAERYLLQTIDYKLNYPNPMNFLRRNSKADQYNVEARTIAKYLMEATLVDHAFLICTPSMIAAASLYLARVMLNRGEWHANLIHYSTFTEEQIIPCAKMILQYLIRNNNYVDNIFNKYLTKRFMKASLFVRRWVMKYGLR
ncbi:17883_t:CDS:2, partial [Entrophospora sp. SA101]